MEPTPVIEVSNVSKVINGKKIVDQLSFEVFPGEIVGLLGPNGAGKTTVIRMMVGLMAMTAGDILIHSHSIRTQFEEAIRHVGAIVENPELYPFLSGYKNLLHYSCMVPGITKERMNKVVSIVKLDSSIHDPVRTYSLGMRQRLGVAQAILHEPSILILDEPTNGLDPAGIRELRDYLHYLAKEKGTAVVVSSHLLSEMELMCDRVVIMQQGRLVKQVNEMEPDGESMLVQFEVDQLDQISDILKELNWNIAFKQGSKGFEITLKKAEIAVLNTRLAYRGIQVYEIKRMEKTLEDRFLEMTEGDYND
ncbi:ABC transporter ATP-binding protein [Desmospora activa]|uniref:ABC-2 type transport system ATP-binding protein n=1 Tax=Desmospora activa DSM 45169 TaxID=1121389 RepID=A0A2T4ZCJ5_9BACL|nr:ABC transporter ATP-binding protein [Desmospora activa]PTM59606.1 ABC-2 type transport system ATP-binding protein [Desmospora activa DSM 45169]